MSNDTQEPVRFDVTKWSDFFTFTLALCPYFSLRLSNSLLCSDGELISKLLWLLSVCSLLYPSDGKLKEGDQILAINGQPLDQSVSHQQAIVLLQRASDCVSLTVARGPVPQLSSPVVSRTPSAASTLSAHSSAVRQTHTHTDLGCFQGVFLHFSP